MFQVKIKPMSIAKPLPFMQNFTCNLLVMGCLFVIQLDKIWSKIFSVGSSAIFFFFKTCLQKFFFLILWSCLTITNKKLITSKLLVKFYIKGSGFAIGKGIISTLNKLQFAKNAKSLFLSCWKKNCFKRPGNSTFTEKNVATHCFYWK